MRFAFATNNRVVKSIPVLFTPLQFCMNFFVPGAPQMDQLMKSSAQVLRMTWALGVRRVGTGFTRDCGNRVLPNASILWLATRKMVDPLCQCWYIYERYWLCWTPIYWRTGHDLNCDCNFGRDRTYRRRIRKYLKALSKDGSPAAYLFKCRYCGKYGGYSDCDWNIKRNYSIRTLSYPYNHLKAYEKWKKWC